MVVLSYWKCRELPSSGRFVAFYSHEVNGQFALPWSWNHLFILESPE